MLICEELFLLLTTDEGTKENWGAYQSYGLTAALVADLVVADRLALGAEKDPSIQVLSTEPLGDRVLDPGLEEIAARDGKAVSSVITGSRFDPTDDIVAALAARGVIGIEPKRWLGLVPAKYPMLDDRPEVAVRRRLAGVLQGRRPASVADVTLLSVLCGMDMDHTVLAEESGELSKRELKDRIEHLTPDEATGPVIRRSVEAMTVAITTAVIVPLIIAPNT